MGIWDKIKAFLGKESEYVDFEQFQEENYHKTRFSGLERYKKRK